MFEQLEMAPPDAILGLTEAFKADPNPAKINLGVGVYKDENNLTPILESVKRAEERILASDRAGGYLSISGSPDYARAVQALIFGADHEIVASGRAATAHTPGGTGALRVAGDFIHVQFPSARIWMSSPTWANHGAIFAAAGVPAETYAYYDHGENALDFDGMLAALQGAAKGDVVLLHGCCHNPTGMDPSPEQWRAIAALTQEKQLLPLLDFAYQGFGAGLEEDAAGLRTLCATGRPLLVCSSFSKNFGLYCERAGALTVVGESKDAAQKAFSHVKKSIRANYSNPPAHGGAIVTTILGDAELRAQWEQELETMRGRIHAMRNLFVEAMHAQGVDRDYSFIARQEGMFSFSGLTKAQVEYLRKEHAIYIVGSGRINVAGMTPKNMDALCTAIAQALKPA